MLQFIDPVVEMFAWQEQTQQVLWKRLYQCSTLQSAVEQIAEMHEFQWHPYFIWVRSRNVDCAEFVRSQRPFQHTVNTFAQALGSVFEPVNIIPASEISLQNATWSPQNPAQDSFDQCLHSLDASKPRRSATCSLKTAAAHQRILAHCRKHSPTSSAAMLGMIEYLYADISAILTQIIQQRGWADTGHHFCYAIHDVLNPHPSRDLLTLASQAWHNPETKPQAIQSLMLGAQCLWEVYDSLYPE